MPSPYPDLVQKAAALAVALVEIWPHLDQFPAEKATVGQAMVSALNEGQPEALARLKELAEVPPPSAIPD